MRVCSLVRLFVSSFVRSRCSMAVEDIWFCSQCDCCCCLFTRMYLECGCAYDGLSLMLFVSRCAPCLFDVNVCARERARTNVVYAVRFDGCF